MIERKKNSNRPYEYSIVIILTLIITIIYTYPLINHINSAIPFTRTPQKNQEIKHMVMGDHLSMYYNLWLLKNNIYNLKNPLSDSYQFRYWKKIKYNPHISPFSLFYLFFSITGSIIGYNLFFIFTFILASLCTYMWLKKVGLSSIAAFIGSIIFCLAPHRMAQVTGHLNGWIYFSFPLIMYLCESTARSNKIRYPIILGTVILLLAMTEYHMLYYTFLFLIPYFVFHTPFIVQNEDIEANGHSNIRDSLIVILAGIAIGLFVAIHGRDKNWPSTVYNIIIFFPFALYFFWKRGALAIASLFEKDPKMILNRMALSMFPFLLLFFTPICRTIPISRFKWMLIGFAIILSIGYLLYEVRFFLISIVKKEILIPSSLKIYLKKLLPLLFLISTSVIVVMLIKHLAFEGSIAEGGRSIKEIWFYSPKWEDIWKRFNGYSEKTIYLGVIPLILSFILILTDLYIRILQKKKYRILVKWLPRDLFWTWTLIFSTLLSLGFTLQIFPIYPLFYEIIPFFNYPRVPGRIIFIAYGALAYLVARATESLLSLAPKKKGFSFVIVFLIIGAILYDYYPPRPLGLCRLDKGHTIYEKIDKNLLNNSPLLELPIWPGDSAWSTIYQYYITRYEYPMLNGYSPVVPKDYVEEIFFPLYPLDVGELTEKGATLLSRLKIPYILFHREAYPFKISPFPPYFIEKRLKELPELIPIGSYGPITLFKYIAAQKSVHHSKLARSPVGILWEAEKRCPKWAEIITTPDASSGKLVKAPAGRRGIIMEKQNRLFPKGQYKGIIRVGRLKDNIPPDTPIFSLIIASNHRKEILYQKEITARDLPVKGLYLLKFFFKVDTAKQIECIVHVKGTTSLLLDYLFFAFEGEGEGDAVFEAEDLFHQAEIVSSPFGKGKCVRFTPLIINDRGINGPHHLLKPGTYKATYWMALDYKNKDNPIVAQIMVTRDMGKDRLRAASLTKKDFHLKKLSPFSIEFTIDRPSVMDFNVYYQGKGILWVDRIEVKEVQKKK